ncbi:gamma-glutamyl-gamma-aminobutyrate hydrolase family protein [Neoehrlichia mikurensis]|uniref:Gamma-glutamyl-gamma-aminobutyrate hydrolase family protein n=1 Tax=Neoehrlichia mikurensis TaxID=89586 RepID=A0A9Q9BXF5_9RICK|nr:gamma-glutamyl-gamma-aminobutyrate hydrolase family protein [Neoehrlichia mikurensis]QXK91851.1 gamma-glutamyl-gamma-aminobutyrate hydrolase family protein [Neoehrlichia mikurensis]QXK93064.1 gamma-glutamyl-gamma-aminobutyrate hydrolase family protein [Neoehrlichia mikurensis]QXK93543.1 gamma-glutamyl-gamma-aminobutyrate hydrolase family protein [Neoehrlichia mikurensis]UTO55501.1 gamma-glutamyl-gamma-aminobutyrate hydrolase family protein [Neoehrlichia mikurensis]UTO56423.1 gamma-glutamyl-
MQDYIFYRNKTLFYVQLLFILLLLPYNQLYASLKNQNNVIVGILSTKIPSYPTEYKTAVNITKILNSKGVKVVLIDYNTVIKSAEEFNSCGFQTFDQAINFVLSKFIHDNGINRILIPGNYYNISSSPLNPSPNRQLVTNSIVTIVKNNPKIHLLAICGGLQGIMHAQGILVNRIDNMVQSQDTVNTHIVSMPYPYSKNANLHQVIINLNSRLANIICKTFKRQYDRIVTYLPDSHHEAINSSSDNIKKMYALGYKVVAISEDGIIEAVEDVNNNILLQMHPEYLLMNYKEKLTDYHRKKALIISDAIIDDFLYRK